MIEQVTINNVTIEQLKELITKSIKEVFAEYKTSLSKPASEYITRKDVAAKLKVSVQTVKTWAKLGKLKQYRIGRRVLFKPDEIEGLLKLSTISKSYARL